MSFWRCPPGRPAGKGGKPGSGRGRRWGRRGHALDGRVAFHMAGDDPFGELGGIIFKHAGHDDLEDVQGDDGLMQGVGQAAGGVGFGAGTGALDGLGGLKGGNVVGEVGDEIGVLADADHGGGEGHGVGGKGVGGIEQGHVAVAVGHEEFAGQVGRAEQGQRMGGAVDAEHVVVDEMAGGGLGHDAAVLLPGAGELRGAERFGLLDGGADEGELLSADAGGRVGGDVFDAKGGGGDEGVVETVFLEVHNNFLLVNGAGRVCADLLPAQ